MDKSLLPIFLKKLMGETTANDSKGFLLCERDDLSKVGIVESEEYKTELEKLIHIFSENLQSFLLGEIKLEKLARDCIHACRFYTVLDVWQKDRLFGEVIRKAMAGTPPKRNKNSPRTQAWIDKWVHDFIRRARSEGCKQPFEFVGNLLTKQGINMPPQTIGTKYRNRAKKDAKKKAKKTK
jgi:hypothetical protein